MAESDATVGFGSIIKCDGTKVAQSVDLPMPEPETGDVKFTNNDSPDNTHEYMPGLIEPGEFEFDVVYAADGYNSIYAKQMARTTHNWSEVFPDGSGWTFRGYVKKCTGEAPTEDEAIKGTFTIKVTGKPVHLASGAS